MSEIQFIVHRLNEEPFELNLSLVTFDEQSPFELLTLLNDVLAKLDSRHQLDLRDEQQDVTAHRMLEFLHILKYQFPTTDMEQFKPALLQADRNVIYPILHWLLQRFPQLQKRAYLAKYLVPVEVPIEFIQGDPAVAEMFQHYKEIQMEFTQTHKTLDKLRHNTFAPGELKREIGQLQEERSQLMDKIAGLKRKTAGMNGFEPLLAVTSALRREQEEESKLVDRMREQQGALQQVEMQASDVSRRLMEMRSSADGSLSPQDMLARLEEETRSNRELGDTSLPQDIAARKTRLAALQETLSEPAKTESDVMDLKATVRALTQDNTRLNNIITEAQRKAGDDKLAIFRQQSALIARKLAQKEEALEVCQRDTGRVRDQIDDTESQMRQVSGSKFMRRDEFQKYANQLRSKTTTYKAMTKELAEVRAETVVLSRTEQILKGRDAHLEEFLQGVEAQRGVTGHMDTQENLESVSSASAQLNQTKGKTLEQISKIVADINQALKERKNKLAPQIKELRAVRQRYQELEQDYLEKKSVYENTAVGLESERLKLENECGSSQEECLREESRYHYLNCLSSIETVNLKRIEQEESYERGESRLLRDFRTYRELYANKASQQEALSKELRKRQRALKESAPSDVQQRARFADLQSLLQCKVRLARAEKEAAAAAPASGMNGGGGAGYDAMNFEDFGGANVMTLGDS